MAKELVTKTDATGVWEFTLKDRNGAVNLTEANTIELYLAASDGTLKIDGGTCTIVSATSGTIKYAPTAGDVDTAGTYDLEIEVTWTDGTNDRFPSDGYTVTRLTADLEG